MLGQASRPRRVRSYSPDDMSADHRQLRPVVDTAVPSLSLLRGDNEPKDQVVEVGRPEM